VDSTAPDTSLDSAPPVRTSARSARFAFSASEAGSGLWCKLDDRAWSACASPRELTGLSEGKHTLLAAAIDAAGNADPTPASHTWTVVPGLDRIESRLSTDLAQATKALKRMGTRKLSKRGRFTVKGIDMLLAGKLSVVVKGATVVAKGSRRVSGPGRYAVTTKLTRKGRRMLRRGGGATLTVRIKFGDELGRTATTSRSVALRR
jgi:hypothetical protein